MSVELKNWKELCKEKDERIKELEGKFDLIVEKLEEEKIADIASYDFYREKGNEKMQCSYAGKINAYKDAIEIVKGVIDERD